MNGNVPARTGKGNGKGKGGIRQSKGGQVLCQSPTWVGAMLLTNLGGMLDGCTHEECKN